MKILLDTNFAVTCTRQKIDFFSLASEIIDQEIQWLIPQQVLQEIKELSNNRSQTIKDRRAAILFLEMLDSYSSVAGVINIINLDKKIVDNAIVDFCKKNNDVILATLDKRLKSRVRNQILTIKGKNFIGIQKDINSF
jgi:rRNA-processing protein FCF1